MSNGHDVLNGASKIARSMATVGDTVIIKARPNYRAVIEADEWGRLTVRPLPDQGVTTRARAVWRKAILDVCSNA